jgi:protein-tyrosine phosphatase
VRPVLFTIERPGDGRLSTMAHPRGGRWLARDMRWLAAARVDVLVSMLADSEAAQLGLAGEGEAAERAGLSFHRLPTPDMTVPDPAAALALAGTLASRLAGGGGVAVHCWAGIGRSSTLAAAVLVLEGLPPAGAWQRISAARGRPVPETDAQRAFVDGLRTGG